MKNNKGFKKLESKVFRSTRIILILLFFVLLVLISSCSLNKERRTQTTIPNSTNNGPEVNHLFQTNTPLATPTIISIDTPTVTPNANNKLPNRFIENGIAKYIPQVQATTDVITVLSTQSPTSQFLYHNLILKIHWDDKRIVWANINLDDLNNNTIINSDIVIQRSIGTGGRFYTLYPVNGAVYYFSNETIIEKDTCLKKFPISGMTAIDYLTQEDQFYSGKSYCIITDIGRMAIVNYLLNSSIINNDFSEDISVNITVYSLPIE